MPTDMLTLTLGAARLARTVPGRLRPRLRRPALADRAAVRGPLAGLLAALLVPLLALPGAALAADVRIAVGERVVHALLADAATRDAFAREGVEVVLVPSADPIVAVADGEADLAATTADALLGAEGEALELRAALLLGFALENEAVLGGPDVRSLTALRGAAVAVEPGSGAELMLDYALQRSGLSIDGVRAVAPDPDPAAIVAALADGTLAAAALGPPALQRVEAIAAGEGDGAGPLRRLASAADRPGLVTDVLAGEERWLRDNREPVKGVIRARTPRRWRWPRPWSSIRRPRRSRSRGFACSTSPTTSSSRAASTRARSRT